jgi:hypothetical protein
MATLTAFGRRAYDIFHKFIKIERFKHRKEKGQELLSAHCTEGLMDLSLRWVQPIQQQGRRILPRILLKPTAICFSLVASCFTVITQQIHSLRASGVISAHSFFTLGSELIALLKSAGNL